MSNLNPLPVGEPDSHRQYRVSSCQQCHTSVRVTFKCGCTDKLTERVDWTGLPPDNSAQANPKADFAGPIDEFAKFEQYEEVLAAKPD